MSVNGTTTARGYGWDHQTERKRWQHRLNRDGFLICVRCGQPITVGQPWDLGHNPQRTAWTGPEHMSCNRADGGRRHGKPRTSRDWQ